MKKLHYLLLALVTITFISCGGEKNRYQPIQGYKGMVKRIVSYNYENDFQKNKIISKYGVLIPKYIKEYNKYGNETMNVIIDLPDDDDEQVCVIYIDSISYDKKQKQESLVRYTIYTNTNEKGAVFYKAASSFSVSISLYPGFLSCKKSTLISYILHLYYNLSII